MNNIQLDKTEQEWLESLLIDQWIYKDLLDKHKDNKFYCEHISIDKHICTNILQKLKAAQRDSRLAVESRFKVLERDGNVIKKAELEEISLVGNEEDLLSQLNPDDFPDNRMDKSFKKVEYRESVINSIFTFPTIFLVGLTLVLIVSFVYVMFR